MITQQYERFYHKFIVNPVAPVMIKFSPSVVTLIRCTIGTFSSILYMKGFYVLTMAVFMLGNSLNTLHASIPGAQTRHLGKMGMTELICDRFLEVALFFVYCYLETDVALFCFWAVSVILICVTTVSVIACFLKKSSSAKPASPVE